MKAESDVARCRISAADTGSSSCASSTPDHWAPAARSRRASPQLRISATGRRGAHSGTTPATAASGTVAALRVAWTQRDERSSRSAAAAPRGRAGTCPRRVGDDHDAVAALPKRAAAISASSRSRPTSGHHRPEMDASDGRPPGIRGDELYARPHQHKTPRISRWRDRPSRGSIGHLAAGRAQWRPAAPAAHGRPGPRCRVPRRCRPTVAWRSASSSPSV